MKKPKLNSQTRNALIIRRYLYQMKEARGLSQSTINKRLDSLGKFQDFFGGENFCKFNDQSAVQFKKYLATYRTAKKKALSLTTQYQILRIIEDFFRWLMVQPGYKSFINSADIEFLRIDRKSVNAVRTSQYPKKIPTLEYVLTLTDSIKEEDEVSQRDRALISFTLISGMRASAILSLSLGTIDEAELTVNQDPKTGVKTKFSKVNLSKLMIFDDRLLSPILNWIGYLKNIRFFTFSDPLFPAPKIEFEPGTLCFSTQGVKREYFQSQGPIRRIFKDRAEKANLPYFSPHTFRHLAVRLALDRCDTPQDVRAVSQNFGHKYIATTVLDYARLDDLTKLGVLGAIDFTGESKEKSHLTKSEAQRLIGGLIQAVTKEEK